MAPDTPAAWGSITPARPADPGEQGHQTQQDGCHDIGSDQLAGQLDAQAGQASVDQDRHHAPGRERSAGR